jgi:hypothetical protein
MKEKKVKVINVELENGLTVTIEIPVSFTKKDIVRHLHMRFGSQQWLAYKKVV